jgi:MORN repeat
MSGFISTLNHPQIPPPIPPMAHHQQRQPEVTQRQVTYQTVEMYIGQWLQVSPTLGYPHGWGCKYGNSEVYEGQWHEGLKHGQGTRTWSSGEKYEGGWKENKRQGYGIQTYVDGSTYEGGWNDDQECGYGKKTKTTGEVYSGGFCDGKEHGYAVREHNDGRKYEGGIKDGQAYGFGRGTFKNDRRVEGGWKDGKAHGWGTEEVGTLKHVGNFESGFWDGPGEQTYGKKVTKGEWKKGKLVEKPADKGGKPADKGGNKPADKKK